MVIMGDGGVARGGAGRELLTDVAGATAVVRGGTAVGSEAWGSLGRGVLCWWAPCIGTDT